MKKRTDHYFTADGTYGEAGNGQVVTYNTTRWTDEDWQAIEGASDSERQQVAKQIHDRIQAEDIARANRSGMPSRFMGAK